jgi:predicted NBD/HSP70 family sugar kinase
MGGAMSLSVESIEQTGTQLKNHRIGISLPSERLGREQRLTRIVSMAQRRQTLADPEGRRGIAGIKCIGRTEVPPGAFNVAKMLQTEGEPELERRVARRRTGQVSKDIQCIVHPTFLQGKEPGFESFVETFGIGFDERLKRRKVRNARKPIEGLTAPLRQVLERVTGIRIQWIRHDCQTPF